MILYVLKQNKNSKSAAFGKWFAFPVIEETIDLDALAEHMSNHNTPYSKGAIKGMLTDMVGCIKELLLEGKNVKIADLAIFSLGIKNNGGAASEEVFSVSKNIKGVKLRPAPQRRVPVPRTGVAGPRMEEPRIPRMMVAEAIPAAVVRTLILQIPQMTAVTTMAAWARIDGAASTEYSIHLTNI